MVQKESARVTDIAQTFRMQEHLHTKQPGEKKKEKPMGNCALPMNCMQMDLELTWRTMSSEGVHAVKKFN